jgi:eukaryotic-like serine/threonine-protein kinase
MIRPGHRGWAFITVAVLLAGLAAVLTWLHLPGAVVSSASAGLLVIAGVWSTRGAAILQAGDTQRQALNGGVWRHKGKGFPLVRELADPALLGIHPAVTVAPAQDRWPPFVARDVGGRMKQELLQSRFVLVVGESTAGKSRAAYELVRAELPDYHLVQPVDRDEANATAAHAAGVPRVVLWLDDLERFLGSGGLTGASVRQVLSAGEDRYIVATMRSEEHAKFSGRPSAGFDGIGRDALRQGWDVLRLATRIEMQRIWSPREIAAARQMTADYRLAEAVRHSAEYGIAEYLAAAPQLLAEWRDAWAPGTHPRAAAMILAAVDARRAGIHRPLPLDTVIALHEPYLRRRGGDRLRPESISDAVAWAVSPLYATSSLLIPAGGDLLAFDYLIDAADQDRVPGEALDVLISIATPAQALDIGRLASSWSLISQADAAYRRAESGGLFEATAHRCFLIGEHRAGNAAALQFARDAADWTTAVLGPDHPQALEADGLIAWQTLHSGDPATALSLFRDLAARSARVLGPEHQMTLDMRAGAAGLTGDAGEQAAAARLYEELAGDCSQILGASHETTIMCRDQSAMWVAESGDPHRGASLFQALLADMTGQFSSRGDDIFRVRSQLASCLTQAGEYPAALREWDSLVADTINTSGHLRSNALYVRERRAWCAGEAGNPGSAVSLLKELVADVTGLGDPGLIHVIFARRSLAWWTGEAGSPAEAQRELAVLVDEATAQRGAQDRRVRVLRLMLTHWNAMNSPADTARGILQSNTAELSAELGPAHEVTRACLRELAKPHSSQTL